MLNKSLEGRSALVRTILSYTRTLCDFESKNVSAYVTRSTRCMIDSLHRYSGNLGLGDEPCLLNRRLLGGRVHLDLK